MRQPGVVALLSGFAAIPAWGQWVVTNLHPAGATESRGLAVRSGMQVGTANFAGLRHAGLWTGSSATWVNLTPAAVQNSTASGIYGNQQVGYIIFSGGVYHAVLWSGAPAPLLAPHAALCCRP